MYFEGVRFHISPNIPSWRELAHLLKSAGGLRQFELDNEVTHAIVSPDAGFEIDNNMEIVTQEWVTCSVAIGSRAPEQCFRPGRFLQALTFSLIGIPNSDAGKLQAIITTYGGKFVSDVPNASYVLVGSVQSEDYKSARASNPDKEFLHLEWLIQSVKAQECEELALYRVDMGSRKRKLCENRTSEKVLVAERKVEHRLSASFGPRNKGVFDGVTFYICNDRQYRNSLVEQYRFVLKERGACITNKPHLATHALAQLFTEAPDLILAKAQNCTLVTPYCVTYSVFWCDRINEMCLRGCVLDPMYPLHIPRQLCRPRGLLNGKKIAATGFRHSVEVYRLKCLVEICGGVLTQTLSKGNSFLICKSISGKKYRKAGSWSIPRLSIKFLEDTVNHCKVPDISDGSLYEPMSNASESIPKSTWDKVHFALTGIDYSVREEVKNDLLKLGGIETDVLKATHVVSGSVVRTSKLLQAISCCPFILDINWVRKSKECDYFVDEMLYPLLGNGLQPALERRQNIHGCRGLLAGKSFFATPHVHPNISDLEQLITASGGLLLRNDEDITEETIILACKRDMKMGRVKATSVVYSTGLILDGVFNQKLILTENILKNSE
eukprot:m.162496 g.162496  ORF g.162496 m.162496 type:complete len:609 (-) comp15206_c0_seq1:796-2622(-)